MHYSLPRHVIQQQPRPPLEVWHTRASTAEDWKLCVWCASWDGEVVGLYLLNLGSEGAAVCAQLRNDICGSCSPAVHGAASRHR